MSLLQQYFLLYRHNLSHCFAIFYSSKTARGSACTQPRTWFLTCLILNSLCFYFPIYKHIKVCKEKPCGGVGSFREPDRIIRSTNTCLQLRIMSLGLLSSFQFHNTGSFSSAWLHFQLVAGHLTPCSSSPAAQQKLTGSSAVGTQTSPDAPSLHLMFRSTGRPTLHHSGLPTLQ